MRHVRFVGLDVHAETIAVAVAEPTGEVRSLGIIPNGSASIRRLITKLGAPEQLWVCYEAGPTGYAVYWEACIETPETLCVKPGSERLV
jgi:transposase